MGERGEGGNVRTRKNVRSHILGRRGGRARGGAFLFVLGGFFFFLPVWAQPPRVWFSSTDRPSAGYKDCRCLLPANRLGLLPLAS